MARGSAWIKANDYWDAFIEFDHPSSAIASIIEADRAGCFPIPAAYKWLVDCLNRWANSFATDKPISLDAAFGLPTGRGHVTEASRVKRLKRDRYIALHMQFLTALDHDVNSAAEMIAAELSLSRPHIGSEGIVKLWRTLKRSCAGWLPLVARTARNWSDDERRHYLRQYAVRLEPRKRGSK